MLKLLCNFVRGTEGRPAADTGGSMIPETFQVCYDKLWKLLRLNQMKKKDLQRKTNLSSAVIAKLGKGMPVHLNTLLKICSVLHCSLDDIVDVSRTIPEHS